jgi:hypothetical protein
MSVQNRILPNWNSQQDKWVYKIGYDQLKWKQMSIQNRIWPIETEQKSVQNRILPIETEQKSVQNRILPIETEQKSVQNRMFPIETEQVSVQNRKWPHEIEQISVQNRKDQLKQSKWVYKIGCDQLKQGKYECTKYISYMTNWNGTNEIRTGLDIEQEGTKTHVLFLTKEFTRINLLPGGRGQGKDAGFMCPRPKTLGWCAPWTKSPLNSVSLTDVSQPWTVSSMELAPSAPIAASVVLRHLMDQWGVWPASPTPLTRFIGLAPLRRMHARPTHRTQIWI